MRPVARTTEDGAAPARPGGVDAAGDPAVDPSPAGRAAHTAADPAAGTAPAGTAVTGAVTEPIIDAPEPPGRVHRPLDLVRLLVALAGLAAALLIGALTVNTVAGIGEDVNAAISPLSSPVVVLATAASGLMLLVLPVGVGIDLLYRRRFRVFVDAMLAMALALLMAAGLQWALTQSPTLSAALVGGGAGQRPLNGFIAAVVAMVTVARLGQRHRWRVVGVAVFGLVSVTLVSIGFTALAVVVSLLVGRVAGLLIRWAVGSPPSQPSPRHVVTVLRRLDIDVVSLRPRLPDAQDPALLDVRDTEGRNLFVLVLDRDHVGAELLPSLWRALRVRQAAGWWTVLSLRRTLEQLALVNLATATAGAKTTTLLAAVPVDPDAAMLVYEDLPGPTFAAAPRFALTDRRLDDAWEQLTLLHRRAIAHRSLDATALVATEDGGTGLRGTSSGQIAAGETALRIDLVQLLITCAVLVGCQRAVASALRVVGPERLATAVPLLQPIVLSEPTRRALRDQEGLLDELREEILAAVPSAPVEPVRIERLRVRTVVSAVALTVAAYVLVGQVAGLDLVGVVQQADWRWLTVAAVLNAVRYVSAALGLIGFVAERIAFWRAVLVQVASSFLALVAPAGVGGAALNVRFLQRSGVPAAAAVASVALWQLGTFVTTVVSLVVINLVSGANQTKLLSVPFEVVIALAVLLALAAVLISIPAGRRFVGARLRPYMDQVRPRMGSVLNRPGRLLTGLAGTLLQTAATVLVMGLCIHAFGGSVNWVVVALIVLGGTAIASAAPTPGGLGAVEAVLVAGLTAAAGLEGAVAVSSVLLFRLLTFWLPVIPGWIAFTYLQRKEAV